MSGVITRISKELDREIRNEQKRFSELGITKTYVDCSKDVTEYVHIGRGVKQAKMKEYGGRLF